MAFGAANAGLFKKEDVSLGSAADCEPIVSAMKAQPLSKLHLIGAPVDCDETPTVSDSAATALRKALEAHGSGLKSVKLMCHRFESDSGMEEVLSGLTSVKGLEELDLTNSSLGPDGGAVVARVLGACTTIHTLKLEDCGLEEDGCLSVASGVA